MLGFYEKTTGAVYFVTSPLWDFWSKMEGAEGLWAGRLGYVPAEVAALGRHDIWLQAVSVGEVGVAEAIVHALDARGGNLKILVSSSTPAGMARAMTGLGERCSVIPYPLDFPQVVRRVIQKVHPRVYACIETELWPNLIREVRRSGAKTVLLNGRISSRTFPRYRRIPSMTRPLLGSFSRVCAISPVHADRLVSLGASPGRVSVTGNAKFEGLLARPDPAKLAALRNRLDIPDSTAVLVAGSIREGEENSVVGAYILLKAHWPDLVLFLVPRHTGRVAGLEELLAEKTIPFQLWSKLEMGERRGARVILVDVVGPLFSVYGLATVAFVGGSLVPKGGQNLMEPAAWECPVVYGPYTENFDEARVALQAHGGGEEVRDTQDLVRAVDSNLRDPARRTVRGRAARAALLELAQGAATRQAEILLDVLRSGA